MSTNVRKRPRDPSEPGFSSLSIEPLEYPPPDNVNISEEEIVSECTLGSDDSQINPETEEGTCTESEQGLESDDVDIQGSQHSEDLENSDDADYSDEHEQYEESQHCEELSGSQPSLQASRYLYSLSGPQKQILLSRGLEQSAVDKTRFSSRDEAYAFVGRHLKSQRMISSPVKRVRLTARQKSALLGAGYSASASELDAMRFSTPQEGYDWVGSKIEVASPCNFLEAFIYGHL